MRQGAVSWAGSWTVFWAFFDTFLSGCAGETAPVAAKPSLSESEKRNLREHRERQQAAAADRAVSVMKTVEKRSPQPLSLLVAGLPLRMRSPELRGQFFKRFSMRFSWVFSTKNDDLLGLFRGFSCTDAEVALEPVRVLKCVFLQFCVRNDEFVYACDCRATLRGRSGTAW